MGSSHETFINTTLTNAFTNAGLELALCSEVPGPASEGVELSGSGYERATVFMGSEDANQVVNSAEIEFPAATDNWLSAVGWVLYNSDTGSPLVYGIFSTPVDVVTGHALVIPVGAFVIQME